MVLRLLGFPYGNLDAFNCHHKGVIYYSLKRVSTEVNKQLNGMVDFTQEANTCFIDS